MGRLKFSLITEPKFAHDAAAVFREMKQFEEVDLINSKAIADSEPRAMENSLYEAVETKEAYVDVCLFLFIIHEIFPEIKSFFLTFLICKIIMVSIEKMLRCNTWSLAIRDYISIHLQYNL